MKNEAHSRTFWPIASITAAMAVIFVFFQLLPGFAPDRPDSFLKKAAGTGAAELCDVSSLGFTAVNQDRSPLSLRLVADSPQPGRESRVVAALSTPAGRPITWNDLAEAHTKKFHLLAVDPTLADYHHIHPVPTAVPGEYEFTFAPRAGGSYRFFADLLPVATGRPIQAVADVEVPGEEGESRPDFAREASVGDFFFRLSNAQAEIRAGRPSLVTLEVRHRREGAPVQLQPVMGAFAHLVAFDSDRSGFAHMHPLEEGLEIELDGHRPELSFMFFARAAGTYTVWAQVKVDDAEVFAPFTIEVL